MKLPETIRKEYEGSFILRAENQPNVSVLIESIVRDCAKACAEAGRRRVEGYAYNNECAAEILRRYGLEAK